MKENHAPPAQADTSHGHTIPGEFVRMEIAKPNPIETAHRVLIVELGRILVDGKVPRIHVSPMADEFLAVKDYVAEVARIADTWLAAIGKEARSNSLHTFDQSSFQDTFTDAVEGYALYELEAEAEELGELAEEIDRDTRQAINYGRTMHTMLNNIFKAGR